MKTERSKQPRVYFADMQRKWSVMQSELALDLIEDMARHGDDADPLGEAKPKSLKAA